MHVHDAYNLQRSWGECKPRNLWLTSLGSNGFPGLERMMNPPNQWILRLLQHTPREG